MGGIDSVVLCMNYIQGECGKVILGNLGMLKIIIYQEGRGAQP